LYNLTIWKHRNPGGSFWNSPQGVAGEKWTLETNPVAELEFF
jgi:hypothetical protein